MWVGDEINVNMELWRNHTDCEQDGRNPGATTLTGDKMAETLAQSH